jgi:hypothetical protein
MPVRIGQALVRLGPRRETMRDGSLPVSIIPQSPRPTREELLAFLDALAEPVGPEVFAGYGGEVARLRHEVTEVVGDPFRGVFEAQARVDALVDAWALRVDPELTLDRLVEIATARAPGTHGASMPPDRWVDALCDVLVAVAQRAPRVARPRLQQYIGHAIAGPVVVEVLARLDDDD